MVNLQGNIKLFDFQENAVLKLIDLIRENEEKTILFKAPTGSGKTIIMINFVNRYLENIGKNVAFIWLCPGKGDLEEQSKSKMIKYAPQLIAQNLYDALLNGFSEESTTFINWELITKKGNKAITDNEKKNLFDRIKEAHLNGIKFIIIIDEEHSNNTSKAADIINGFNALGIIRMSATVNKNKKYSFYEIDENDVIDAGLITKAIVVNEGLKDGDSSENEISTLLELADKKRKEVISHYKALKKDINPLVLIQFRNGDPQSILNVEEKLNEMGYSYENGFVSKWMSEDKKDLPENLTDNNSTPCFLLMKQAISTGWDCPRAKILVKLREGMDEQFEIQTIGRIRRMPEAKHYNDDVLDFCYVYTFDEEWKNGLFKSTDKAYEVRRLFLKDKCKTFTLEKEIRDNDFSYFSAKNLLMQVYDFLQKKYHFSKDYNQNSIILSNNGYILSDKLVGSTIQGSVVKTEALEGNDVNRITLLTTVNTHIHGIKLLHAVDSIKKVINLSNEQTKILLTKLFRKKRFDKKFNILRLENFHFYAFIINNEKKLVEDLKEMAGDMPKGLKLKSIKTLPFFIPKDDLLKYDPSTKLIVDYLSNAYEGYTSEFNTSLVRWKSERLFEKYCEENKNVDWVYKNGDVGQQYFSIVYLDAFKNQPLFYPDYIVKMKNGEIWIIEAKGGEEAGKDKNIDKQIENKFYALKEYARKKNLNWGFVRALDEDVYINNTIFVLDMHNPSWTPIEKVMKKD